MEGLDGFSLMPEDWQKLLLSMGEKPFRGKQIFEWLHAKGLYPMIR